MVMGVKLKNKKHLFRFTQHYITNKSLYAIKNHTIIIINNSLFHRLFFLFSAGAQHSFFFRIYSGLDVHSFNKEYYHVK